MCDEDAYVGQRVDDLGVLSLSCLRGTVRKKLLGLGVGTMMLGSSRRVCTSHRRQHLPFRVGCDCGDGVR